MSSHRTAKTVQLVTAGEIVVGDRVLEETYDDSLEPSDYSPVGALEVTHVDRSYADTLAITVRAGKRERTRRGFYGQMILVVR